MTAEVKENGAGEVIGEEKDKGEAVDQENVGQEKSFAAKTSQMTGTASKTINEAFKQVENLGKALGSALQDRANVVMVRVNNDSLDYLDMLVEADVTKSRSESAAFLINEGIKANEQLFNKIRQITDQISALKAQLRQTVEVE